MNTVRFVRYWLRVEYHARMCLTLDRFGRFGTARYQRHYDAAQFYATAFMLTDDPFTPRRPR